MGNKFDELLEPGQPALILMYGDAARKRRPLSREAMAVGRARGCDIWLDAPDVSSLHCLITRNGDDFHLRDCGSRSGTRLNGDAVREATLHDGDILQVGPFSFRVHLPAVRPVAGRSRAERVARSRRNLARLALAQRRRLQQRQTRPETLERERQQADLDRQAAALRDRVREYDQRFARLDQAERDLSRDCEALAQESEAFQARKQQAEEEWTRRQAQCATEPQACPRPRDTAAGPGEEDRRLEIRRRELDAYAQHLNGCRQRLQQHQEQFAHQFEQLTRGFQAMQLEQKESTKMREEWAREQAEAGARLAQQRAALAQAEAALREQRAGLTRMMADLKQMQEAIRTQQNAELEDLRRENEQLHQLLAERERAHEEAASSAARNDSPNQELQAEIDLLRQLLQDKDALLEELRQQPPQPGPAAAPATDIDTYEAELNEFRQQLEGDRKKLNEEIEQLRLRNLELDEATREMELELSRERAELGRERQRLDRLREEARLELERAQREAGVRDRLAPVQKLREEITGGSGSPAAGEGALTARLRGYRSRPSDATT